MQTIEIAVIRRDVDAFAFTTWSEAPSIATCEGRGGLSGGCVCDEKVGVRAIRIRRTREQSDELVIKIQIGPHCQIGAHPNEDPVKTAIRLAGDMERLSP